MSVRMNIASPVSATESRAARVDGYDWQRLSAELSGYGCAVLEKLLSPDECREIARLYPHEEHFRSHIHMARHGFGKGEYRYFKYPLPIFSPSCARRSIRIFPASPTIGMSGWASTDAIPSDTRIS